MEFDRNKVYVARRLGPDTRNFCVGQYYTFEFSYGKGGVWLCNGDVQAIKYSILCLNDPSLWDSVDVFDKKEQAMNENWVSKEEKADVQSVDEAVLFDGKDIRKVADSVILTRLVRNREHLENLKAVVAEDSAYYTKAKVKADKMQALMLAELERRAAEE